MIPFKFTCISHQDKYHWLIFIQYPGDNSLDSIEPFGPWSAISLGNDKKNVTPNIKVSTEMMIQLISLDYNMNENNEIPSRKRRENNIERNWAIFHGQSIFMTFFVQTEGQLGFLAIVKISEKGKIHLFN